MKNKKDHASSFISVLRKMLELCEEEGEVAVPINDIRILLRHFELNDQIGK